MADETLRINLKVLSPSTEVNGDLSFGQIPASTTVKELKLLIQNEIASHPSVDRMRLIYRGRVLATETDTMVDIFGLENVRDSPNQSLHLVLRELHNLSSPSMPSLRSAASPAPRSSTAPPPNPFRPTPPTPPTNPFRAPPIRPNSQPQAPNLHQHHQHNPQPHNPFAGFGLPPPNNLLQQQIVAQAMAQAQMAQAMAQAHVAQGQNPTPLGINRTPTPTLGAGTTEGQTGATHPPGENDASSRRPSSTGPRLESEAGAPNQPPGGTRTIRHETLGPHGERWTMTINSGNITIPVAPPGVPPFPNLARSFARPQHLHAPPGALAVNTTADRELHRVQIGLEGAQREMENVRTLLQAVHGDHRPFTWRQDEIRRRMDGLMHNLDQMQSGLSALATDPTFARNRNVLSLQMLSNNLRSETGNLVDLIDQRLRTVSPNPPSTGMPTPSSTTTSAHTQGHGQQDGSPNPPSVFGPELFVLSSPQGPVGILFDERGTYRTAPFVPTLPFQSFNQQFASNRQILAAVGQQMAQLQNQAAAQTNVGQGQAAPEGAGAAPPPAAAPAGLQVGQQDRVGQLLGHAWLLCKLLIFLYFFSGGDSWYRPIMIGLVGAVAYIAQLGIFEEHLDRIRRHFEALVGLNDRAPNAGQQAQGNANQANNREPTPEEAAQRLVQQRQGRYATSIREGLRTTERAFALFVASLWPGLGERMVQAQEERVRAARAVEEERRRAEEEQAAKEREEAEGQEKTEPAVNEAEESAVSKGKGKEKVEVADETEAGPSSG